MSVKASPAAVSSMPQPLALAHCFLRKPHTLHSCPIFGQIFVGSFLRAMVLCPGALPSWSSVNTSIVCPAAPLPPKIKSTVFPVSRLLCFYSERSPLRFIYIFSDARSVFFYIFFITYFLFLKNFQSITQTIVFESGFKGYFI